MVIDALRRSSAKTITAVIPYFGYARQDRKAVLELLSQQVVANLISNAGASRVVTVDLHAGHKDFLICQLITCTLHPIRKIY